ncbi:MBL fold metallo-hydrolase [Brevibacterium permense]|uniref:MBL fold metallo-hydrolase n=1 Tax=Brevibacterium permense TaxID=234834 RepID=UPI0021D3213B|nr:MBL fold metallo-hydrolase [Brevibacterium permense]MCU4298795.1 MBL fold metallo-hydrolase [Brevibacterium permense]
MTSPARQHVQPIGTTDLSAGFLTRELKEGVFLLTNGNYQTIFFTTGEGIVLLDAPSPLMSYIQTAISDVTDERLRTLVYSHGHTDHIGGAAAVVGSQPDTAIEIIAEAGTTEFLVAKDDPARPLPTFTYEKTFDEYIGARHVRLFRDNFHSADGDTVLYLPDEKILVAIDLMAPGWVPLLDFDITENVFSYMRAFDRFLAFDFDYFLSGHTADAAVRSDVELTRDYVMDIYRTVKRLHDSINEKELLSEHRDSEQEGIKRIIDTVTRQAADEIIDRWKDRTMRGTELWTESHARAMVLYVRWSD